MFPLALSALAPVWLLQQSNTQALLALPVLAWPLLALCLWCLAGGRPAAVFLLCGWALLRAGWLLETHLLEPLAGQDVLVRGVLCDFPRSEPQALRFLLLSEPDETGISLPARLHLSWYDDPPAMRPGERWQLRVRLRPPRGLHNPGGFDFEHWLYTRGIGASGYVRNSSLNQQLAGAGFGCPLGAIRGRLAARIEEPLRGHPAAGHVLGVAVGATHLLTEDDWKLLRQTGTTHLLAISGLNIAMVAAPFLVLGPLIGRAHAGLGPAIVAAAAYSALSGFAVSTVRALIMLSTAVLLVICRRRVLGVDLLSTAALVVLIIDPAAVVSISFWLSFLAVGWLFVAAPGRPVAGEQDARRRPAERVAQRVVTATRELVRAQVVLGLGLAPVTLAWFHQLSTVAPVTNLIAVPVFSFLVMPFTLLGSALVLLAPEAGGALLTLAADVTGGLLAFLRLSAETPLTVWEPPPGGAATVPLALAAALVLSWWRPLPLRILGLAMLLPLVVGHKVARPALQVTALDVGQGLAVIVQTRLHALLYDAGPAFRMRDAGESVVVPALRKMGVRHLDAVVISHDDQDHSGGAAAVLRAFPEATMIAPMGTRLRARRYRPCDGGLSWQWDGVQFHFAGPDRFASGDADNDGSCVLLVASRGLSVLLPGDIGRRQEEHLVGRGRLVPVDVVIAPHHGSRTSSSPALVTATRPKFVVFSVGHRNRWGFPAPEVRGRWAATGACLLDTATSGAIVIAADDAGAPRIRRRERADGARLWTADVSEGDPCRNNVDP